MDEIEKLLQHIQKLREMTGSGGCGGGTAPSGAPTGMTTSASVGAYMVPLGGMRRGPNIVGMRKRRRKRKNKSK